MQTCSRQQSARARSRTPTHKPVLRCHTTIRQLRFWAEGSISAVQLGDVMLDMVNDKFEHPSLVRLSRLKRGGDRHCHENLQKILADIGISGLLDEVL